MNIALKSAALVGASSVTLANASAKAIAADSGTSDPIFAAIERHRQAEAVRVRADDAQCRIEEDELRGGRDLYENRSVYEAMEKACAAATIVDDAVADLLNVVPTTPAGVLALVRHLVDAETDDLTWSGRFLNDNDEERSCHHFFFRNLAKALPAMLQKQEA